MKVKGGDYVYWLVRLAHGNDKSIRVTYPVVSFVDNKEQFIKEYGEMIRNVWGHRLLKAKEISKKDYDAMTVMCGDRTPLFRALDVLRTDYKDRYGGIFRKVYRFLT